MSPTGRTVPEDGSRLRTGTYWVAPLALLFALWLWAAFASGGYLPRQWLPIGLVVGLFGLVAAVLVAYPRRPRQLSLSVLTLFALYALWVAFSVLWGDSTTRAWLEAARVFGFLLLFALALLYLTDARARRAFRYLVMGAALVLFVVCVWRLWSADGVAGLFSDNRFFYPVSYTNNAATLFLVAFWPLMWLAAAPEERAPVRGVALGLATGLLGLALMTQSRGAMWSMGITLVLTFIVSPIRLRTLLYLIVPALLMVYAFPQLNRYWLENPDAVGGGVGARSLLVASITAAFMGVILALLERWVKVSNKMKAIFGTVILVGVVAAAVYGSVTLTSDVGGPFQWISQTWEQFTSDQDPADAPESGSRFAVISSSGRIDLWRVGWQAFRSSPALGVGADSWVFQYDLLRTRAATTSQQVHSLELQVLSETGMVGGVLAFGGMLLGLGAVLWPRCTAGWRQARETWLRRQRRSAVSGAHSRFCNPRWGKDPAVYGWETALFVGIAYWIVHASIDWQWQMAGVTIPMLLFLATAIAGVDARVEVLWPRLNQRLKLGQSGGQTVQVDSAGSIGNVSGTPEAGLAGPAAGTLSRVEEETAEGQTESLFAVRRTEKYLSKQGRRRRREERRRSHAERFQPPGILSHVFRFLLLALSLIVLVSTGLPFLSLQIEDSALGIAKTDGVRAAARAEDALWLQPADPGPFLAQARIYSSAASEAAASGSPDGAGAVLDNLALSVSSYQSAIRNEPADWTLHFYAGVETLNLLIARLYASGETSALGEASPISSLPGLKDWSALSGSMLAWPEPGAAAESLAKTQTTRQIAGEFRRLSPEELRQQAVDFLEAAQERNPLAEVVREALNVAQILGEPR